MQFMDLLRRLSFQRTSTTFAAFMRARLSLLGSPLFVALLSMIGGFACSVTFNDSLSYSCTNDADCGGDGFVCAMGPSRTACCKPDGDEICDGRDNNCDGLIDNRNLVETCNGEDDNCDGRIDEVFNLRNDINNCGECKKACAQNQTCQSGLCVNRVEINCFNGFDDDDNNLTDCDDPSCDLQICGAGCQCRNMQKAENICDNNLDDEMDGKTDCLDPDCSGLACRDGCLCRPDGGQLEQDCTDGVDNDQDGDADCLDDDCVGQFCTPPEIYFQCTTQKACRCNGGVQIAEVGSVRCADNVDNDCNGKRDCQEDSCAGSSCQLDGGLACQCVMGAKKEVDCANGTDDDGDQQIDCADSDCEAVSCVLDGGATCSNGTCN